MSTNYYLSLGLKNVATAGELQEPPTLPLPDSIFLDNLNFIYAVDGETLNDEELLKEHKDKLTEDDTLIVLYSNPDAQFILDEWVEQFKVPDYQREEVWGFTGIKETYNYFTDAEEENWFWLVDAQVDYYDDEGNPVPLEPEEDELEEDE